MAAYTAVQGELPSSRRPPMSSCGEFISTARGYLAGQTQDLSEFQGCREILQLQPLRGRGRSRRDFLKGTGAAATIRHPDGP